MEIFWFLLKLFGRTNDIWYFAKSFPFLVCSLRAIMFNEDIFVSDLEQYNAKRRFAHTSEPRGQVWAKTSEGLRFVVQHHIASRDHFDFRLEWSGVLKSWAIPKGPSYDSRDKRLAVRVEDHPLEYRNFEGVIPRGEYGGGVVMIWDQGFWRPLEDPEEGLDKGSLKFCLEGSRLKGNWALVRMKPREHEKDNNWLLIKEKDEYDQAFDIKRFDTSARSGRTMSEIAGEQVGNNAKEAQPVKRKSLASKAGVKITSPDKILYKESGLTKADLADYYLKISKRMLPYLENRILSVVRCPGGIAGSCFYKKHPVEESQGLVRVDVPSSGGETEEYYYLAEVSGLMHEVQMNTLEFHIWGSRVEKLEQPDMMVFDLDPDEALGLTQIRQGVKDLKSLLSDLSLTSYLKTSGGKGYHVVVPFLPGAGWDRFHEFARNVAKAMEAKWPDLYTSNVRKNQRKNRIFIDWMRNGRGATSVAPYSARARKGAPVSMPIAWKELDTIAPQGLTIREAVRRLRTRDPWADFFTVRQQLK